jgi:hypothetical protein
MRPPKKTGRTRSPLPKAHDSKWTLVWAVGGVLSSDRVRLQRFDTQSEAEAGLAKVLESGERAFVQPPLPALGSKSTTTDEMIAQVRDQLTALYAAVGLLAVERDPQEIYAGMVDAAGMLGDLARAMLEAGLTKDDEQGGAYASLIAAAPDLLAALERMLEHGERLNLDTARGEDADVVEQARAAVKKARRNDPE